MLTVHSDELSDISDNIIGLNFRLPERTFEFESESEAPSASSNNDDRRTREGSGRGRSVGRSGTPSPLGLARLQSSEVETNDVQQLLNTSYLFKHSDRLQVYNRL